MTTTQSHLRKWRSCRRCGKHIGPAQVKWWFNGLCYCSMECAEKAQRTHEELLAAVQEVSTQKETDNA